MLWNCEGTAASSRATANANGPEGGVVGGLEEVGDGHQGFLARARGGNIPLANAAVATDIREWDVILLSGPAA
jgi:hypothetical protein